MNKSLYKILEISENATADEIKKAYRKLAKQYHPDINKDKDAEEKFKEINTAYEILSDSGKKAKYDQYGDAMFNGQDFHTYQHQHSNMDMNDMMEEIFRHFAGNGFGGSYGGYSHHQKQIEIDVHASLNIDIELAKKGGELPLQTQFGNFTLKIPKNIRENDVLKVKGKGRTYNGKTGDLYLSIEIVGNEKYQVNNYNVYTMVELSLKQAIFGDTLTYNYFGENLKVKIPEGIKNGQKLKIAKKGIEDKKYKHQGDLYLIVEIKIPKASEFSVEDQKILKEKLK